MVSRLFSRVQDGGSGCANEESLSPFHPNMMLQTLPAQNSDYPDWSGGRIEPEKELWRPLCLGEICPHPHPQMDALRIYASLSPNQLALYPDSLHPIFSGYLAGFLPLVTGADHCQFCTDLEITKIMKYQEPPKGFLEDLDGKRNAICPLLLAKSSLRLSKRRARSLVRRGADRTNQPRPSQAALYRPGNQVAQSSDGEESGGGVVGEEFIVQIK